MSLSPTSNNLKSVQSSTRHVFKWEIQNCSVVIPNLKWPSKYLEEKFVCGGPMDSFYEWRLSLTMSVTEENQDYLCIALSSRESFDIEVEYMFFILDSNKKIVCVFGPFVHYTISSGVPLSNRKFVKRSQVMDKKSGLLDNDVLTICCSINVYYEDKEFHRTIYPKQLYDPQRLQILDTYEQLLNDKNFGDLRFVMSNGQELYINKAMLICRSPVFAAMFRHNTKERIKSEVQIEDFNYEVMRELFRFLYCGKVTGIDDIARELYAAADKYAVEQLKILCERCLTATLCIDNALELLAFAHLHKVVQLKRQVKKLMIANVEVVVKKPEFNAITDLDRDLIVEMFKALVLRSID